MSALDDAHETFRLWFGDEYDLDALDVVLAAAAVEQLDGDPVWLLVLSGSGNAKTETVQALAAAGAVATSTISSQGALLSATAARERSKKATGGLLRTLEPRGLLVIKDVTSILSMNHNVRAEVLGALREVYDGSWSRNVGTDGGQTLSWRGRIVVIGAVTSAWDKAHNVIATMGDRFVIVRIDSMNGRQAAGRRAIANTGQEQEMRRELGSVVAAVLGQADTCGVTISDAETEALLAAADVVTRARTGVEFDYRGDVDSADAPEMPTRFAKQLAQIVRGAVSIGVNREHALRLAIRCARDSMPPMRLAILDDVAASPDSSTSEIRKRIDKPRTTVDRQLQALHALELLTVDEYAGQHAGRPSTVWRYRLRDDVDPNALDPDSVPGMLVSTPRPLSMKAREGDASGGTTHIAGTELAQQNSRGSRSVAALRGHDE